MGYTTTTKKRYKKVEDDFTRHLPSLDIVLLRPEQMGGALGMTYINSNYIILRDTLHGDKKYEVEVHEIKHRMNNCTESEESVRQYVRNMLGETYYH